MLLINGLNVILSLYTGKSCSYPLKLGISIFQASRKWFTLEPIYLWKILMNWISVADELPPNKHEVMYFATMDNGQHKEIMVGHREDELWTHCCMFYSTMRLNPDFVEVTHWMELPDYPK